MKPLILACIFALVAVTAFAQPPTAYTLKIFNQGASQPVSTTVLPASGFVCGLTPKLPTPTGAVANGKRLVIDDPANPATMDCLYVDPGTGPLVSLPFGVQVYTATINVVNSAGTSSDVASLNSFTHPGTVAPVPTGVRVVP